MSRLSTKPGASAGPNIVTAKASDHAHAAHHHRRRDRADCLNRCATAPARSRSDPVESPSRIARAPALLAANTSESRSPIITTSAGSAANSAIACCTNPGAGLRQSHSPTPCGQMNHASTHAPLCAKSVAMRASTAATSAVVASPSAMQR